MVLGSGIHHNALVEPPCHNGMTCRGLAYRVLAWLCLGVVWCAMPWLGMACSSMVMLWRAVVCCGLAVGFAVASLNIVDLGGCWLGGS